MSYFIFLPNLDNIDGTLYRIAENESDFNNLNISKNSYKIIEDTQSNFDSIKYENKLAKYNNNLIIYTDQTISFKNKEQLQQYVISFKNDIKKFTDNNPNHPLLSRWNDYSNQLSALNFDSITYPLNKSLEQYFKDQTQTSLNPLQLP
jgi:hypothetical protein